MSNEQNQILETILQELKNITAELQLLRSELKVQPYVKTDEAVLATSPGQVAESLDETEEESALAVYDWLRDKGITVKNYREQSTADMVFDQLAAFLGERFKRVQSLLFTGNGIRGKGLFYGADFAICWPNSTKFEHRLGNLALC